MKKSMFNLADQFKLANKFKCIFPTELRRTFVSSDQNFNSVATEKAPVDHRLDQISAEFFGRQVVLVKLGRPLPIGAVSMIKLYQYP
jgi:hypothetical protein